MSEELGDLSLALGELCSFEAEAGLESSLDLMRTKKETSNLINLTGKRTSGSLDL